MPETPRGTISPFRFFLREKFSKLHFAQVYANTKARKSQFKREGGTSPWSSSKKTAQYPPLSSSENLAEVNFLTMVVLLTTELLSQARPLLRGWQLLLAPTPSCSKEGFLFWGGVTEGNGEWDGEFTLGRWLCMRAQETQEGRKETGGRKVSWQEMRVALPESLSWSLSSRTVCVWEALSWNREERSLTVTVSQMLSSE